MGSIGAPEILVILVVALLVLGPERLPDAARTAGRLLGELRRMSEGLQVELRDAMATPPEARPPTVPWNDLPQAEPDPTTSDPAAPADDGT